MSLTAIKLPIPILLHGLGMSAIGLRMALRQPPSSTTNKGPDPNAHVHSLLGITTLAIGLCYITTCYMDPAQNAMLYASIPVRILLASLLLVMVGLHGKSYTAEGRRALLTAAIYDGLSGIWLGWYLGEYLGRCPGLV